MIVADTDVLIDFLADRGPAAERVAREIADGALATTVINRFELLSGARTDHQLRVVQALLDVLTVLPLDRAAADRAADVRRALEARGAPISMGDCLVAGIVLGRGGALLTGNRARFERIEGLELAEVTDA